MPRMTRIAVPNFPHHIVQRGHNCKAGKIGSPLKINFSQLTAQGGPIQVALKNKLDSYRSWCKGA